ncbi:signal peptidase [Promicromonospora sp. AC04]|uniref:signal peptidase I n=1 Tax=Promicromonospora sp. AC04 TaxID=2135723 RepID=UPI000D3DB875|nr:signal peptidase I [Promicromonospora sp. AC04]PUB25444.1 signal peptidase [Promicromonospora sp. AC04]
MQTAARLAGRVLAVVVIVVAGAALVLGVIVPRFAGATPYVVLTDSMEPSLPAGTLVVSRPVEPEQIRTGSVITYQLRSGQEQLVTHRVVGIGTTVGGERTYVTQGDSNDVPDAQPVRDVQVRGAAWYRVPYLGHVAGVFTGQRAMVGVAAAVLLLGYAGWQVARAMRERSARARARPAVVGPGVADDAGASSDEVLAPGADPVERAGPIDDGGGR